MCKLLKCPSEYKIHLFLVTTVFFLLSFCMDRGLLAQQWPFKTGIASSTDIGRGIALDATNANVHITGNFGNGGGNPTDFDPGTGVVNLTANGSSDIFVAKYTNGNPVYQWAINMGTGSPQVCRGNGIAVDGSGNVYVTGYFEGTVNFNPAGTANRTAVGLRDIFVAKYNSSGLYQWAFNIGAAGVVCNSYRIRVDGSANVYITGAFQGTADFDPVGTANLVSAGSNDIFFAKYDKDGLYQWAFRVGTANSDEGLDIAVDNSDVYICGYFDGTANFNPSGTANLTSTSGQDGFVAKYTAATGAYQWAFRIGIPGGGVSWGNDQCWSIAIDASANVYVTGTYKGIVNFNPSGSANLPGGGSGDMFVAKYTTASAYVWAFSIPDVGTTGTIFSSVIATDGTYVYLTGRVGICPGADFDPSGSSSALIPGSNDIFIAKYTAAAGAYVCAFNVTGGNTDEGLDIDIDANQNIYVTGDFQNTADFDPAGTFNMTSAGNQDIFAAKYNNVCAIVLPVELVSFTGKCTDEEQVILNWATASETNNDYFEVQRNIGMLEGWKSVGTVKGAGNSSTIRNYEFTDVSSLSFGDGQGERFYRLKQTDYDGKYEYSPITSVHFPCQNEDIAILPNPSSGIFAVTGLAPNSELSVYNVWGEKVFLRKSNNEFIIIDLSDKPEGVYFIQIKTDKESFTHKLIIHQ